MNKQSDVVSLVNISTQKWPPRHRTYFGSLTIQSPEAGTAYAVTPVRGCTSLMDLGDRVGEVAQHDRESHKLYYVNYELNSFSTPPLRRSYLL